ncbi:CHAP domain-containing protein [Litoribrevibacter albus]|uniref:CHAP domain-containing protein n=1 Tax=Litoribrevibacter albus TaxID=1473156 RepID=UPI0024E124D2|nr:CHAP domain-containing protein [Litoribrevibacter albus]
MIENSRSLSGTPYDPFMGMYDNIGGRFGFIVCSDVPNIAYGKAGYSFKILLEKSFNQSPDFYDSSNGNNPSNPFFHRRARNLFSYFQSIDSLKSVSYSPQTGDLVFYRKSQNGYIAHVALVTEVFDGGYRVMESAPKTLFAQEVDMESPIERGWILAGFGKVY